MPSWTAAVAARLRRRTQDDAGYTTLFWLIWSTILLGLLAAVIDGTGAMNASARADDIAAEAARAGGQQIDPGQAIPGDAIVIDPDAAAQAARAYLDQAGTTGSVRVSADATEVFVTVTDTYDCYMLGTVGYPTLEVSGKASATLVHQVGD